MFNPFKSMVMAGLKKQVQKGINDGKLDLARDHTELAKHIIIKCAEQGARVTEAGITTDDVKKMLDGMKKKG